MMKQSIYILLLMLLVSSPASSQALKLFSPEMRESVSNTEVIVMDFLERYFNKLTNLEHTNVSTKMADDKVYFRKGQQSDLYQITDSMTFSISLMNHHYEVEWKNHESPFVTIVFPAQYDLLLGMQQEEAQQKMKETIFTAPKCKDSILTLPNKTLIDSCVYMSKTESLEIESVNDATYFIKVKDSLHPYFDSKHLDYSAANLFHGLIRKRDYRMYIEQSVYGLKTTNYTLSLSQWLDYCASLGLKVFFGVEEERKDGILALVIAQSRELGFNHMLSIAIPDKFTTDKNAVLKVRMTPYIPIHNIKNLFQKESVNHRKKNWQ